jgi:hypothetical protein
MVILKTYLFYHKIETVNPEKTMRIFLSGNHRSAAHNMLKRDHHSSDTPEQFTAAPYIPI